MIDSNIARQMWTRFEPIHAVTYFSPESRAAFEAAGLRGYWRGYFAGRAAPLGPVDAAPVIASFFGFSPAMVGRAVPDVWTRATPAETLAARSDGAATTLARMLAGIDESAIDEATTLAETAVALIDPAGCVLGAANAAIRPDETATPLARLWQALTVFREHRGDCHMAALLAGGFDGCESIVWRYAHRHREEMQQYRGWTDEQWDAAVTRLTERGWIDADGGHTPAGEQAYASVEAATDRAAGRVWRVFGGPATERLRDLLTPMAIATYPSIPAFNPVGVPNLVTA